MDADDESYDDPMSMKMLEDIYDGSQSHPNVNRREAPYKIRDSIRQTQSKQKEALKGTQNIGKGLHKVFKTGVKYILQQLRPLGESGSEVSHFIPEPRNFSEVTNISDDINKPWLKTIMKEIKSIFNNQTFIIESPEKVEPLTPCMDTYKAKIQSDGSLDKLKLRIVVRGDLHNK